jgi:uncharacterized protein
MNSAPSHPAPPLPRSAILWAILAGTGGGAAFALAGMPLPWMLGALSVTLVLALAGARIVMPERVRDPTVAVIGVLLGSSFTPDLVAKAGDWGLSLAGMVAYLALAAAVSIPVFRRLAGHDRLTAYFAAMPGGLTEMAAIGGSMGADERKIILAHMARIVVTIAAVAFWFRVVAGYDVVGRPASLGFAGIGVVDAVLLVGAGVLGTAIGYRLRLPAPTLFGPMILSGLLHVTGVTSSAPPGALVIAAQVILGTVMGCRFRGVPPREVFRAMGISLIVTVMTLALALAFAALLHRSFGQTTEQVLLAYAPGGLTEMSLIALAMQAEVAFVAVHHVARIVIVIAFAPLVARAWR